MQIKKLVSTIVSVVLLVVAIFFAIGFIKNKPQAKRKKISSMIPVVKTAPLKVEDLARVVPVLGTVIAEDDATLEAEVSGKIVFMNESLVEGSFVKKGDLLFSIDDSDYKLAVETAKASLLKAESDLRLEEGQQAVAKHEMELIGGADVDVAYRDLMLREPQLKTAQANLATAKAKLEVAELDLNRTKVLAPFDGVVLSVDASAGDFARSGKSLVSLADSSRYFIQCSLPISSLSAFPNLDSVEYVANIELGDGSTRSGVIYKMLPDLSKQGHMARLLISVKDPLENRALLIGEVANVELQGALVSDVSKIDRVNWRDGGVVWMIDAEGRLQICETELVQGTEDHVLVRVSAEPDWKLVTSNIFGPVDGMQLRVQGAKGARPNAGAVKGPKGAK